MIDLHMIWPAAIRSKIQQLKLKQSKNSNIATQDFYLEIIYLFSVSKEFP